jgi:GNAT superfamily N-acetyltransferase
LINKLKALTSQMGLGNALVYALNQACHRWVPVLGLARYHVVAQPVPDRPLLLARRRTTTELLQVYADDPHLDQLHRPRHEIDRRFRAGAVCFMAMRQGRCLGFIWLSMDGYVEPEHWCDFRLFPSGKAAWDLDLFIDPAERGGMLFAQLWDAANAHLRAQGVSWTMSRISAFNHASLAAHRRLGIRVIRSMTFVTIGAWQLLLSLRSPWIHVCRNSSAAPVIRVEVPS